MNYLRLKEIRKIIVDPAVCWHEQALAIAKDLLAEVDRLNNKVGTLDSIASNGWVEAWHSGNMHEPIQAGESHEAVLNAWQNSQTLRAIQQVNSGRAAWQKSERLMVCRRCSECRNSDHHWMYNPDFGNDDPDAEPEHNPNVSHICKHCEQEGYECGGCDGEGCDECNGAGVLPIPF